VIQQAIASLVEGKNLSSEEVDSSIEEIISGQATPAQVGGFLVALRGKGETAGELAAFATAFRRHSLRIRPSVTGRLVDTCGTGGDGANSLNVSTIAAIVAAGAGVTIAKHGNRSVTGKCGSADLLESLGFNLAMEPSKVRQSIEQVGIGFMFAPTFHPAMKQVIPVRRELGIRTIFNLMGPLMNPAGADSQLLGVYSGPLTQKIAEALVQLGTKEGIVVHALEGMDEISVSGKTLVSWISDGKISSKEWSPEDFGVRPSADAGIKVSSPQESAQMTFEILAGRGMDPHGTSLVLVNAAAAIILGQKAASFAEALPIAKESLDSGAALKKLEGLVKMSGGDMERLDEHATA